jgi:UDP-glucose 4-epimerase
MKILVVGGAGYVGSHFCQVARESGHDLVVFDDLSAGHRWAVGESLLVEADLMQTSALVYALSGVDAVCHFAAKIVASESVARPELYFTNNVGGTANLLNAMITAGCTRLVFSSTAAVYGNPDGDRQLIREDFPTKPINPYGESKLAAEKLISEWVESGAGNATIFRYFNAAGAIPERGLGEYHQPETHLIPNVLNAILDPARYSFTLYGNDYPTADGTCVRDYVHVKDIASAHLMALEADGPGCKIFNLGHGAGHSNLEVIRACENLVGKRLSYEVCGRRLGDPARLVTDNRMVLADLGWKPVNSDLVTVLSDALAWHRCVLHGEPKNGD